MGWSWPSPAPTKPANQPPGSPKDPIAALDPSLRAFLDSATPRVSDRDAADSSTLQREDTSYAEQILGPGASLAVDPQNQEQQQALRRRELQRHQPNPPTSGARQSDDLDAQSPQATYVPTLYPDGRYAHLWDTYTASQKTASLGTNPQAQIQEILGAQKTRKSTIGRAAKSNCADFEWVYQECLRKPKRLWTATGFRQAMTLCHHESEKFSRCVVVQGKILRALGFASIGAGAQTDGRGEEGIQIHADHLYHEMLEREEMDERLGKGVGDAAALEKLRQKRHEEQEKLRQRLNGIYWLSEKNKTAHFHGMNVVEANLELDAMETDRKITGERWSTIPGFVKQSEDEIKRRIEARDDEGWFTWLGRWMAAGARTNDKT